MTRQPHDWVDSETGRRVVRLSNEPGSTSLYFNVNGYTPEGDVLVVSTLRGLDRVDMSTLQCSELFRTSRPFKFLFVGLKHRRAYYQTLDDNAVCYVDIDTGKTREVARVDRGDIQAINCDETLLGGVETDPGNTSEILKLFENRDRATDQFDYKANWPDGSPMSYADAKEVRLNQRLKARIPMKMFVIETESGARRDVYESTDWLNHLLFSPTDPDLLMFCHEGNWHCVDRLWLLNLQGPPQPIKLHHRTMNMEIAGHEWFSRDGSTIWYDLQTPRGETFYVAGYHIASGQRRWYHVEHRDHWSVHYHSSPTGDLFCGDGGDADMVGRGQDGKWLYLFTPRDIPDVAGLAADDASELIKPGYFDTTRSVNMKNHDYRLEPNAHFSPDGRWVVFRGNMEGEIHTYAVGV